MKQEIVPVFNIHATHADLSTFSGAVSQLKKQEDEDNVHDILFLNTGSGIKGDREPISSNLKVEEKVREALRKDHTTIFLMGTGDGTVNRLAETILTVSEKSASDPSKLIICHVINGGVNVNRAIYGVPQDIESIVAAIRGGKRISIPVERATMTNKKGELVSGTALIALGFAALARLLRQSEVERRHHPRMSVAERIIRAIPSIRENFQISEVNVRKDGGVIYKRNSALFEVLNGPKWFWADIGGSMGDRTIRIITVPVEDNETGLLRMVLGVILAHIPKMEKINPFLRKLIISGDRVDLEFTPETFWHQDAEKGRGRISSATITRQPDKLTFLIPQDR